MSGQDVRAVVSGLVPATRYTVSVAAVNSVGRGRASPPLTATTHEEAPSAPPQNVKVSGEEGEGGEDCGGEKGRETLGYRRKGTKNGREGREGKGRSELAYERGFG